MAVFNSRGSRWQIIEETFEPSGVTSVTHTGCEDYDWIFAEYTNLESTASSFLYINIGQGATPTYRAGFYISEVTSFTQYYNNANIYPESTTTQTADRSAGIMIPNQSRSYSESANMPVHFHGGGFGTLSTYTGSVCGAVLGTQEPVSAIKYATFSGNLSGTGAVIRTWGYR